MSWFLYTVGITTWIQDNPVLAVVLIACTVALVLALIMLNWV